MLLFDFVHHNIEMACALLESCGRYLYHTADSHQRCKVYLVGPFTLLYFALLQLSLICALFSQNSRFLIACILHCKACVPCDLMFSFKLINGIFLILAYPGCPGKEAVKQMCLCVNN